MRQKCAADALLDSTEARQLGKLHNPDAIVERKRPPMTIAPQPPTEVYAAFAGEINTQSVQRLIQGTTTAIAQKLSHIHLLFHSPGGFIGDGVCLYNYFRALTIDLTLYNAGSVSSVAVLAYLGAKERKTSAHATFMIHRPHLSPQLATADRLQALAQSLTIDDVRTEAILRQHITMTEDRWNAHKIADLWFTADEAVKCGLAQEIGEFAPPPGTQIFAI
jgi:ATP-dependent Clp protease protease subunit